jgi:hypothetical protein
MTTAAERLMTMANRLIQHGEHTQRILRDVLSWIDQGCYDPMQDMHALRLPGGTVRIIRQLLVEPKPEETPRS